MRVLSRGWRRWRGGEDALARNPPLHRRQDPRARAPHVPDHSRRDRGRLRPLGPDSEGRPGPRHLQLRLALVPHALRGRVSPRATRSPASTTTETVLTNWFYPQNSELLHGVGILLTGRDTLSLFLNFGWLAVAFLAAWCIGRPYGRGPLCVASTAVVLECHTLVVREPGAGEERRRRRGADPGRDRDPPQRRRRRVGPGGATIAPVGWPLAAAGLAVGLAVGTKLTALAMAAALTVAVIALAPAGRRRAAAGWWFLRGARRRRLLVPAQPDRHRQPAAPGRAPGADRAAAPRTPADRAGPTTASSTTPPTPASGTNTSPPACTTRSGCSGRWWSSARIAGAVIALALGQRQGPALDRGGGRCSGCSPTWSRRSAPPAPRANRSASRSTSASSCRRCWPERRCCRSPRFLERERWQWVALAALLAVLVLTDRPDAVLRDPSRLFGLLVAALAVLVPAALLYFFARRPAPPGRGRRRRSPGSPWSPSRSDTRSSATTWATASAPAREIPGMDLDSAYVWARDKADARIGLVGTTAGFLGYGFYGTDLSNDVSYLGVQGPHGAFNAIPTCARVPRRGQRRRPRLPRHRAVPQLHPPRPTRALARGGLAARRAGGRAGPPQRRGDGLAGRRAARPERLRARERAAAPDPPAAALPDAAPAG